MLVSTGGDILEYSISVIHTLGKVLRSHSFDLKGRCFFLKWFSTSKKSRMTRRHLCQQGGAQFVRLLALARGFLHLGLDGAEVWVRVGASTAAHEAETWDLYY